MIFQKRLWKWCVVHVVFAQIPGAFGLSPKWSLMLKLSGFILRLLCVTSIIKYVLSCLSDCVIVDMWKAAAGQSVSLAVNDEVDDWETDPDFEVLVDSHSSSL